MVSVPSATRPLPSASSRAPAGIPSSRQAATTGVRASLDDAAATSKARRASDPASAARWANASPNAPSGAGSGASGARPSPLLLGEHPRQLPQREGIADGGGQNLLDRLARKLQRRVVQHGAGRLRIELTELELVGDPLAQHGLRIGGARRGQHADPVTARAAAPRSRGTPRRPSRATERRRRG